MAGNTTIVKEDVTESGTRFGPLRNVSRTYHQLSRPLVTPDEIMKLKKPLKAGDAREAAMLARNYIAQGYSVDLGLMQVNSHNLPALGYTVEEVLNDPCANIRAGAAVLTADYAAAVRVHGEGQAALQAALSSYNTGDFNRGFANGYVARYYAPGGIPGLREEVSSKAVATVKHEVRSPLPNPYTADTMVYVQDVMSARIE
jgi:type IV secretion system protein VirB1